MQWKIKKKEIQKKDKAILCQESAIREPKIIFTVQARPLATSKLLREITNVDNGKKEITVYETMAQISVISKLRCL